VCPAIGLPAELVEPERAAPKAGISRGAAVEAETPSVGVRGDTADQGRAPIAPAARPAWEDLGEEVSAEGVVGAADKGSQIAGN
jgi:hypothetical protein